MLTIAAIGIALVILTGVGYTNLLNTKTQMNTLATSSANNAVIANFSTYSGAIANTAGSNSNYVYYILFMALVIAVVVGALVTAVKKKSA